MLSRSRFLRLYTDCCRGSTIVDIPSTVSKVVCVARNYSDVVADRSASLESRMRSASIFCKPPSSITSIEPTINISGYTDVVCETELAILIGKGLPRRLGGATKAEVIDSISAIGIAFDLTRKDLQTRLKNEGKPWEISKGFDNACPVSKFCKVAGTDWVNSHIDISLTLNGQLTLRQNTGEMILPIVDLVITMAQHMSLWPGDIILTGTPTKPKTPPRIKPGDELVASLGSLITVKTTVV